MPQFRKYQCNHGPGRLVLGRLAIAPVALVALLAAASCQRPDQGGEASLRIYGGQPVPRKKHTAVVALHDPGRVVCSGTLIHPNVILTAGHCVSGNAGERPLTGVSTGQGREGGKKPAQAPVAATAVHPDFKLHPRGNMDIGLAFLDAPLDLPGLTPVPLADEVTSIRGLLTLQLPPGQRIIIAPHMTMVGYGRRQDGGTGKKYEVTVPASQTNPSEILLGGGGQDSCEGDSGGPVFSKDGRFVAVISRGITIGCGGGGIATVIADASCWIREAALERGFDIKVNQPCGDRNEQNQALNLAVAQMPENCGTDMDLSEWYLESIEGLRWIQPDATSVNLKGNHLTDVSELLLLPDLRKVDISFNDIPTAQIEDLRRRGVEVRGANLQNSTFLATAFMDACSRLDQSSLTTAETSQLRAIRARFASNDCATVNSRLVKTLRLNLSSRKVESLSLLAGLPLLEALDISDNPVDSLQPLLGLENLRQLKVENLPKTVLERDDAILKALRDRGVEIY